MVHCAHNLVPFACAASTSPKRPLRSRLGDAIRALTPRRVRRTKNFKEADSHCPSLNVDVLIELNECQSPTPDKMKRRWSDDEISTNLGTSSCTGSESHPEEITSLPGSVEEIPLPSCTSSTTSRASCSSVLSDDSDFQVEVKYGLDGKPQVSGKLRLHTELHQMALLISQRAASKFTGRVSSDVRNAFVAVDTNGDGKVTPAELAAFCEHFDLTTEIATRFFTLLDPDDTGVADWSSFFARYAPVFRENTKFRLNPGVRAYPALQMKD